MITTTILVWALAAVGVVGIVGGTVLCVGAALSSVDLWED
jgi:hypothetical protein